MKTKFLLRNAPALALLITVFLTVPIAHVVPNASAAFRASPEIVIEHTYSFSAGPSDYWRTSSSLPDDALGSTTGIGRVDKYVMTLATTTHLTVEVASRKSGDTVALIVSQDRYWKATSPSIIRLEGSVEAGTYTFYVGYIPPHTGAFPATYDIYVWGSEATPPCIRVDKIKFYWSSSSGAVQMLDHTTDSVLPVPEWDYSTETNEPACYVRGTKIVIQAQFRLLRDYNAIRSARIWANGSLGGLGEMLVNFANGWSDYISFTAREPLPNVVSVNDVTWEWSYRDLNGKSTPPVKTDVSSTHEIFAVWKAPLDPPIYEAVARWTTQWAEGAGDLNTTKDVADAIISKLHLSGLHYGYPAWTVDDILDTGGGMCGGWYKMFHEMAGDQGVFVYDRCYILKRDAATSPETKWIGIVIKDPGLNNPEPTWPYRWWYDVDVKYPYPSDSDIHNVYERRYIFYSPSDGHCVNFLLYDGKIYLYDASFGTGPWPDTFDHIPSGDYTGIALHNFRTNYHDIAIDHMEGTIYMAGGSTRQLDVKSSLIPDLRTPGDPSSFEMHYYFTGYPLEEKMEVLRTLIAQINPETLKDIEEPAILNEEYRNCIEKVDAVLNAPYSQVDWLDVQNAIVRLGELGSLATVPKLMGILNRSQELAISPERPLPGSMSPLDMLKSAAIDSLINILTH